MKILWVNPNFLHPTTKGGQIRTLEMLRSLNRRHEVHYAALENPAEPEGIIRSREYCHRAWPFRTRIHSKHSPAFALDDRSVRGRVLAPELVRGLADAYGRAMQAWPRLWQHCSERNR